MFPTETFNNGQVTLIYGDCLDILPTIEDKSINMIFADLPYGTTKCKWDTPINLFDLWKLFYRVRKSNAACVFTAQQPFTSMLGASNIYELRYDWIWNKKHTTNYANVKNHPLKQHESVLVFYMVQPVYNPIMVPRGKIRKRTGKSGASHSVCTTEYNDIRIYTHWYPKSIIDISSANHRKHNHPTQKPVELLEYLIKTYTNEGDLVLDPTMGSGTTAVACLNTNRRCIGIEKEKEYFDIALNRVQERIQNANQTTK